MDTGIIKQPYSIITHKHSILAFQFDRVLSIFDYILKILTRCVIIYKNVLSPLRGDVYAQNSFM